MNGDHEAFAAALRNDPERQARFAEFVGAQGLQSFVFSRLLQSPARAELPPGWEVETFAGRSHDLEAAGGVVAAATDGGVLLFDPGTAAFVQIADASCGTDDCLRSNRLSAIARDAAGGYWLGTQNAGVTVMRSDAGGLRFGHLGLDLEVVVADQRLDAVQRRGLAQLARELAAVGAEAHHREAEFARGDTGGASTRGETCGGADGGGDACGAGSGCRCGLSSGLLRSIASSRLVSRSIARKPSHDDSAATSMVRFGLSGEPNSSTRISGRRMLAVSVAVAASAARTSIWSAAMS